MNNFFNSFGSYYREVQVGSFAFWAFPIGTVLLIWLLAIIGPKIFSKRKRLKTVFIVNRAWIIGSLVVAAIIIGVICYMWTKNLFAEYHHQLPLLISLIIAVLIPVVSMLNLRSYYTSDKVKEITEQPKTPNQLTKAITDTKRAFVANKVYFLIPIAGFLFLLLYFYKGSNLISVVFDNSGSMTQTDAITALEETFDNLEANNEIVLTTLNGSNYKNVNEPGGGNAQKSITELMKVRKSGNLFAGNVTAFQNPGEAKLAASQIAGFDCCSPICESIWKTHLFINETKSNETYRHKLLIVITDGEDNYINESLKSGKFLFEDESFGNSFPPENVFIIDYSGSGSSNFMQKFSNAGCDVYAAENNKQSYLDALDNALQSFKNNWYLIYWTILIYAVFTIIALLIQPKKIE